MSNHRPILAKIIIEIILFRKIKNTYRITFNKKLPRLRVVTRWSTDAESQYFQNFVFFHCYYIYYTTILGFLPFVKTKLLLILDLSSPKGLNSTSGMALEP